MIQHSDLKEVGEDLHVRLVEERDNRVAARIAEIFLPHLSVALKRRFSNAADPHFADSLASDAIVAYIAHPERFDPSKASLIAYLYMDAYHNGIDLLRGNQKHAELHRHGLDCLEASLIESHSAEAQMIEAAAPVVAAAFSVVTDSSDRELLSLMMEGVRETEAYAEVLGIENLPRRDKAAIVKRHKDRLKLALRRRISQSGGRVESSTKRTPQWDGRR